jgi:hypothetical protein
LQGTLEGRGDEDLPLGFAPAGIVGDDFESEEADDELSGEIGRGSMPETAGGGIGGADDAGRIKHKQGGVVGGRVRGRKVHTAIFDNGRGDKDCGDFRRARSARQPYSTGASVWARWPAWTATGLRPPSQARTRPARKSM